MSRAAVSGAQYESVVALHPRASGVGVGDPRGAGLVVDGAVLYAGVRRGGPLGRPTAPEPARTRHPGGESVAAPVDD
ncbi:hypothetical protein [Streptomyces sp. PU-14G]|uniref:hypothetical protein n=1 Tax=Streptomyces sp. PU-14G TaxID=2800808 RepID=UPI0034E007A7